MHGQRRIEKALSRFQGINTGDLDDDLVYTPGSPIHRIIQLSRPMTFDEYQDALAKTMKD